MKGNLLSCLLFLLFFLIVTFESCQLDAELDDHSTFFEILSPENSGFIFNNTIEETIKLNYFTYNYLYNGSGVAVGDINNDGLADIYMVSTLGENKLFLNRGEMKFEDITESSNTGVGTETGISTGVTMADVNNDGFLDIYLCKSGPFEKLAHTTNLLFINNGDNTFSERAANYGLNDYGFSTMASFFDYNRDGYLDMYLMSHKIEFKYTIDELIINRNVRNPESSDKLFKNNGNGTFTDVSAETGLLGDHFGYGLGLCTVDFTNDGWPDIYVSNDFSGEDYFYINQKDGTFSQQILSRMKHISNNGMGCDAGDFNNDGFIDLIQVDMTAHDHYRQKTNMGAMSADKFNKLVANQFHHQYMLNSLQLNNGNGSFSDIAQLAGVSATDWSWSALFADFDNDGWQDLHITNGLKRDMRNNDMLRSQKSSYLQGFSDAEILKELDKVPAVKLVNNFFRNKGDLTFSEETKNWHADQAMNSNGAAIADLDNDGDLDLVINNIDENACIFKNNARQINGNNYLDVELKGTRTNPFGFDSQVIIRSDSQAQFQILQNARGYQSSSATSLHFGLKDAKQVKWLQVIWPDGKAQNLYNVKANQKIRIDYLDAAFIDTDSINNHVLFTEVDDKLGINYKHQENDFDDFERESLLPHKMSRNGPSMCVGDVNGDGLEDIFFGGAKSFSGELYIQNSNGKFTLSSSKPWNEDKGSEDMGALFFDADNNGTLDLYVCSGGNEFQEGGEGLQDRLYMNDGSGWFVKSTDRLPTLTESSSVVKSCDFDQDGDLDLFVGGRQIPGKYPMAPKSYLLENVDGKFIDVTKARASELQKPGMITDAIWSDFNSDNQVDLILVGEWMPVSLYENQHGNFKNVTNKFITEDLTGMWFSIEGKDIDKDGDQDYVLGNLGLNSKYKASQSYPFEIFTSDFDDNGSLDIVLSTTENGISYPVRGRECSSGQMPFIKDKFPSFSQYATADVEEIYGAEKLKEALHYKIHNLESILLINNGQQGFGKVNLPMDAQRAPIWGIMINDFNHDGNLDILTNGNFYSPEVETTRYDGSVGSLLLGDGKNQFTSMASIKSGFYSNEDARGLAAVHIGKNDSTALIILNNDDEIEAYLTKLLEE